MFMSTAKVNICKPYLKIDVFTILIVLFNMYEFLVIWSQTENSSFQMSIYPLDELFRYILLNRDRIILYYFPKSYQRSEKKRKIILMNPFQVEEYSGFSTVPLGQRFSDYRVCASMAPFNPLWMEQPRVLPVSLICNSVL